jgi:hypothetical protein
VLEVWKQVIGYEDSYEVSSIGRVRSIDRTVSCNTGTRVVPGVFLKLNPHNRTGHPRVSLSRKRKMTSFFVHTLMMRAFVGERPKGYHICHNDGDSSNNRLDNLRYDTPKANSRDKIIHGTIAKMERNGFAKLNSEEVEKIRGFRKEGRTLKSISIEFDTCISNVAKICNHETWTG